MKQKLVCCFPFCLPLLPCFSFSAALYYDQIRLKITAMKCPESYILPTKRNETERRVYFNESSVAVVIHDASNVTELKIQPSEAVLRLNTHIDVEATATDSHGNQNSCKFQVALMRRLNEWAWLLYLFLQQNHVPTGPYLSMRIQSSDRVLRSRREMCAPWDVEKDIDL